MALKSEITRRNWTRKKDHLNFLSKGPNIQIVPIQISYYPIRPQDNYIKGLAKRFIKKLPSRLEEELFVEGSLLLKSDMHISFQKPIDVWDFTEKRTKIIRNLFFLPLEIRRNLIYQKIRFSLTKFCMRKIYGSIPINMDHLFLALIKFGRKRVFVEHLRKMIIYLYFVIKRGKRYLLHYSLEKEIGFLLDGKSSKAFDSIFSLTLSEGIIKKKDRDILLVDKKKFFEKASFHEIRLVNVSQVILNEVSPLREFLNSSRKIALKGYNKVLKGISKEIFFLDKKIYESDYRETYESKISKSKKVGSPFFLKGSRKIGVVLSHGYGSSPGEVASLAHYLNRKKGYSVYGVRLKGHGTVAENMLKVNWQDWYESYKRGYFL